MSIKCFAAVCLWLPWLGFGCRRCIIIIIDTRTRFALQHSHPSFGWAGHKLPLAFFLAILLAILLALGSLTLLVLVFLLLGVFLFQLLITCQNFVVQLIQDMMLWPFCFPCSSSDSLLEGNVQFKITSGQWNKTK